MDSLLDEMSVEDVSFYDADVDATCLQRLQTESCLAAISSAATHSMDNQNTMPKRITADSMDMSMDEDMYMDMLELEELAQQEEKLAFELPTDLSELISGHIKRHTPTKVTEATVSIQSTPATARRRLNLFSSPSIRDSAKRYPAERMQNVPPQANYQSPGFKRPVPPTENISSSIQIKRLRQCEKENLMELIPASCGSVSPKRSTTSAPVTLRKSISMNDADIFHTLELANNVADLELIGDFSRPHLLPLVKGKHADLKSITSDTLAGVISGAYNEELGSYQIIDCRYPYEYLGGHIVGAKNLYTQAQIIDEFLSSKQASIELGGKRNILIFHCEFSTERAPKLSRFLRSNDRLRNTNAYPALSYPEIYLLHNGYKEFFQTHRELCDPAAYRPMLEPAYNEAYRHFRAKSKSWNGTDAQGNLCDANAIAAATRKKLNVLQRRALNFRF